jgi:hypothetical protein
MLGPLDEECHHPDNKRGDRVKIERFALKGQPEGRVCNDN